MENKVTFTSNKMIKMPEFGSELQDMMATVTQDLHRKVTDRRNRIVEEVAKRYIVDNYGEGCYPLLLPCIQKQIQGANTTHYFIKTYMIEDRLSFDQIPLVRFTMLQHQDIPPIKYENERAVVSIYDQVQILYEKGC